jgi:hypothetical protein
MVTKWEIKGHEKYRFSEDSKLYRLPCNIGKRWYGFRLIKEQKGKRWRIDGKWLSWNQMISRGLISRDKEPIEIYKDNFEYPF